MDFGAQIPLGRRIRHIGRLAQITNVFARHGLYSLLQRLGIKTWLTPEQVRTAEEISRDESGTPVEVAVDDAGFEIAGVHGLPTRLRRSLEELGPAFVKLGQVLAVREDLLPSEYTTELRKLHSSVEALPFSIIQQRLKEELGDEKLADFEKINANPLAAGSIAQVHEAWLRSGEHVVIKVQRPNIAQQINVDLSLMENLASLIEKYIPESRTIRPKAMIEEFARALKSELDFVREAGSTTKTGHNFEGNSNVLIPKVYWNYSTARVLTLSKLEGVPSWDKDEMIKQGINPTLLVERGLSAFLQMVFVDGLFHGDLHPGNLLAQSGDRVGFLDFGMVVRLGRTTREHLAGMLVSLVREDFERLCQHSVELSDPDASFDMSAFQHDVANTVAPFVGLKLKSMRSGVVLWELAGVSAKHGVPLPQELIIFLKTLASFEGLGTHLDPDFDVISSCEKFTYDIVKDFYSPENLTQQAMVVARDLASLARTGPLQVRRLLKAGIEGQLKLNIQSEGLAHLSVALDRATSRLAISIIIGALVIGSSILTFARVGREMYHFPVVGLVGFSLAGMLGLYVVWSVLRGGKM